MLRSLLRISTHRSDKLGVLVGSAEGQLGSLDRQIIPGFFGYTRKYGYCVASLKIKATIVPTMK